MRTAKLKSIRILALTAVIVITGGVLAQGANINSYLQSFVASNNMIGALLKSTGIAAEPTTVETVEDNAVLAVKTWSGQAGDNDWTSNLNWEGIGGAGADDDLVFPISPSGGLPSHNNFAVNTQFRSILLQDSRYSISGNQILLTAGISSTASNGITSDVPDFSPNIILDANQTFSTANKDLNLDGVINLDGRTLNVTTGNGDINFNGLINGTGNLNIAGNATIIGNSSGFGSTEIDSGRLSVNSPGAIGNVNLNGGTLQGTGTVGAITANAANGGVINPGLNNGTGNTGVLTTTGASTLNAATTLEIQMFGTTAGTQFDQLRANGSNINLGGANLDLIVGFTPNIGQQFTIVTQLGTGDLTGQFAQGTVINSSGNIFSITYSVNGAVLTYQGNTLTWDGSSSSNWGTAANWDANVAPSNGSAGMNLVFPTGTQNLNNSNNVGGLTLGSIQITGAGYQIFGNAINLSGGISDSSNGNTTFDPDLIFTANQTFSKTGTDNFTMFGNLNMGLFRLTVNGTGTMLIPSNVVGNNTGGGHIAIEKNGTGILSLSGFANNYSGQTRVNAGTLFIGDNSSLGSTLNIQDKTVIASGASLRIATANYQSNENFDLNGAGVSGQGAIFSDSCVTCVLNGDISILSNTVIGTPGNSTISFNGDIFSGATLTKTGTGTLVFNAGATNFAGSTVVTAGKIIVNGFQQNNAVALDGGTVGGNGAIGALSGNGTVAPGTSAGILTVSGTANLSSTTLNIELNGATAGTEHDRLVVTGTTNLTGANLTGSLGFTPIGGQQFTIIQSTGAITGQFAQGNSVNIGGTTFGITYNTNSVVVTAPGQTPTINGTVTYGNAIGAPTPRFVSNVTITGTGSPNVVTTTDAPGANAGQYSLTGFGAGSYTVTPTKTGGINGITSFDAARVAQHAAGPPFTALTGNQLVVADVSGNGAISSFDAGMIAKFVAGPPFTSPGVGTTATWRFNPANKNYASITSSISDEDYSALLMGEVSGNWTNTGARPFDGKQSAVSSEQDAVSKRIGLERGISVELPTVSASTGNEIVVPVSVQGVANKGVIAYEFNLKYDSSVIQPHNEPIELKGTVSDKLSYAVNAEKPGLLRVAVYGVTPIESDGVLLNLKFTAVGSPGSVSPLSFERILLNEDEFITKVNGQVELSNDDSVKGEISGRLLTTFGEPIPKTGITLTDTTGQIRSAVSNELGEYRFASLQVGQTCTIRIDSTRYMFTPLTISISDRIVNVDMIAR